MTQDHPQYFFFMRFLFRILAFIQVGKVRVIGIENLQRVKAPVIVCPNHPHYADGLIFPNLMERQGRYMVDEDVLAFGFGLGALLFIPVGAFPARDGRPNSKIRTCEAGLKFLSAGFPLLIFPEGHTSFDQKLQSLKSGAIEITKLASELLQTSVFIVPAYIRYGKSFPLWIQRTKPPLQYLLVLLGSFYFRGGATVVFGTPIGASEFPSSQKEACQFLAKRIETLDPGSVQGVEGVYETLQFNKL
ncbi:MAG TPA: lysophospholipid acyltransferase family protein [Acidobacteriota bacterium]|nr:lysophospholipid acyltransferase family protein [Acidobacteriota bacterium]